MWPGGLAVLRQAGPCRHWRGCEPRWLCQGNASTLHGSPLPHLDNRFRDSAIARGCVFVDRLTRNVTPPARKAATISPLERSQAPTDRRDDEAKDRHDQAERVGDAVILVLHHLVRRQALTNVCVNDGGTDYVPGIAAFCGLPDGSTVMCDEPCELPGLPASRPQPESRRSCEGPTSAYCLPSSVDRRAVDRRQAWLPLPRSPSCVVGRERRAGEFCF
jgi:hypothetical protein